MHRLSVTNLCFENNSNSTCLFLDSIAAQSTCNYNTEFKNRAGSTAMHLDKKGRASKVRYCAEHVLPKPGLIGSTGMTRRWGLHIMQDTFQAKAHTHTSLLTGKTIFCDSDNFIIHVARHVDMHTCNKSCV